MEDYGNIIIEDIKSRFTKISNALIESETIDSLTMGVYCKIMRLGVKWKLNIKGLSTVLRESESKTRKAIVSLEAEGYLTRHAVHSGGKFRGWDYLFHHVAVDTSLRTSAGKSKNDSFSVSDFRQHCFQTTLLSDMTENGEEVIRIPKDIKNNIDIKRKEDIKTIAEKDISAPQWKVSFSFYQQLVSEAADELIDDTAFRAKYEGWYDNIDFVKTVSRTADWWLTEEAWEYCKKKRKGNMIMKNTLSRNLDKNRIYKGFVSKDAKARTAAIDEQLEAFRKAQQTD